MWRFVCLCFLVLVGCTGRNKGKNRLDEGVRNLVFDTSKAQNPAETELFRHKIVYPLSNEDDALLDRYSILLMDDNSYFVFSHSTIPGRRFDKSGNYLNEIGKSGQGPEEFAQFDDVILDKEKHMVEFLTEKGIMRYDYNGRFVDKKELDINAYSFGKDSRNNYWFYNADQQDNYKLWRMDAENDSVTGYLKRRSSIMTVIEPNFSKSDGHLYIHESFFNGIYKIEEGESTIVTLVDFGNKYLGDKIYTLPADEFYDLYIVSAVASIRLYEENEQFIYMLISEKPANENQSLFYHWFIRKDSGKEWLYKIDPEIPEESYLYGARFMTKDNTFYFLGYPQDVPGQESDADENTPVVSVDLNLLK